MTAYGEEGTYATPPYPYLPPGAMGSSGGGSQGPEQGQTFVLWSTWTAGVETRRTDYCNRRKLLKLNHDA